MRISSAKKISFLLSLLALLVFSGCGINSAVMFKIPKGQDSKSDSLHKVNKYYKLYQKDSVPYMPREDYKLSRDDKFTFILSTNDGKKILEGMSGVSANPNAKNEVQYEYVIRSNSLVLLPVIGEVNLVGLTVKQSEDTLTKLFSKHYLDPFVQLKIMNQRVIVFPGEGGEAKVILLKNNNTTLMEVIAEAGGIRERGKANSIKLMRSINGKREIYPIDLSTIEGLAYADMIVQANDYVYIEPNAKLGRETLAQLTPFLALLTTTFFIFNALNK